MLRGRKGILRIRRTAVDDYLKGSVVYIREKYNATMKRELRYIHAEREGGST